MRQDRGREKLRLTVKLDVEWDADLIAWLGTFPRGQRSTVVRDALRQAMRPRGMADLAAIREALADELAKALAGHQFTDPESEESDAQDQGIEDRYGAKLDRLLGSLRPNRLDEGTTDKPT